MDIFYRISEYLFNSKRSLRVLTTPDKVVITGFRLALRNAAFRADADCAVTKHTIVRDVVLNNMFVEPYPMKYIMDVFRHAQRRYFALLRFRRRLQFMFGRAYNVDTDLVLNPLDSISPAHRLQLIENRTRYTFRLSDLATITTTALGHSSEMFSIPQKVRNPYTNVPFSLTSLMIIFMTLEQSTLQTPILLRLFAEAGYNLFRFELKYSSILRNHAVDEFLRTATNEQKHYYIRDMFETFEEETKTIRVHPSFPIDKIVSGLETLLALYLRAHYCFTPVERMHYRAQLKQGISSFVALNPIWGRLIIVEPNQETQPDEVITEDQDPRLRNYSVVVVRTRNNFLSHASLNGQWIDVVFTQPFQRAGEKGGRPPKKKRKKRSPPSSRGYFAPPRSVVRQHQNDEDSTNPDVRWFI